MGEGHRCAGQHLQDGQDAGGLAAIFSSCVTDWLPVNLSTGAQRCEQAVDSALEELSGKLFGPHGRQHLGSRRRPIAEKAPRHLAGELLKRSPAGALRQAGGSGAEQCLSDAQRLRGHAGLSQLPPQGGDTHATGRQETHHRRAAQGVHGARAEVRAQPEAADALCVRLHLDAQAPGGHRSGSAARRGGEKVQRGEGQVELLARPVPVRRGGRLPRIRQEGVQPVVCHEAQGGLRGRQGSG
mmetsp:Transcript_17650/g.53132  ORF Transcript_17650/g.53132 Transcript_17650/m.53132 type:complete len:241 (+) Transcript_17650:766-1488(+)